MLRVSPLTPALPPQHPEPVHPPTPGLCYRVLLSSRTLHGLPSPTLLPPPLPLLRWGHPAPSTFTFLQFYRLGLLAAPPLSHLPHVPHSAPSACRPHPFDKDGSEEEKKESGSIFHHCWRLQTALHRVFSRANCVKVYSRNTHGITQRSESPSPDVPLRYRHVNLGTYTKNTSVHTGASQGLVSRDVVLCSRSQQFIFCSVTSLPWPSGWQKTPVLSRGRQDLSEVSCGHLLQQTCLWMDSCGWTHDAV